MKYNPVQTNTMPIKAKIKNLVWRIVNKTLFKYTPYCFSIFKKYRVLLIRCFGAKIAWDVYLHPNANIDYPWNLQMDSKSSLGENCWIYAMAPIKIGMLSCIGKDAYLMTGSHDISSNTFDLIIKPITIGNGVWITTGVTILPGISIGDYAVAAANAVVTKDVEAFDVVGGNPAKFIKKRELKDSKKPAVF